MVPLFPVVLNWLAFWILLGKNTLDPPLLTSREGIPAFPEAAKGQKAHLKQKASPNRIKPTKARRPQKV